MSLYKPKKGDLIKKEWDNGMCIIGIIDYIKGESIVWDKIVYNKDCPFKASIINDGRIKRVSKDEVFVEKL